MNHKKICLLTIPLFLLIILYLIIYSIHYIGYGISYQTSISMPEGWYLIIPETTIHRHDIVIFHPPESVTLFLAKHPWAANDRVLMKTVMAVPGDFICKRDGAVWINHHYVGPVYHDYAPGKVLPGQAFCQSLAKDQYLLMSTHIKRSFDGRYFGPVDRASIIGRAIKL